MTISPRTIEVLGISQRTSVVTWAGLLTRVVTWAGTQIRWFTLVGLSLLCNYKGWSSTELPSCDVITPITLIGWWTFDLERPSHQQSCLLQLATIRITQGPFPIQQPKQYCCVLPALQKESPVFVSPTGLNCNHPHLVHLFTQLTLIITVTVRSIPLRVLRLGPSAFKKHTFITRGSIPVVFTFK